LPKNPFEFTILTRQLTFKVFQMVNKTYHTRGKKIDGYNVRQHPNYLVWVSMKQRCSNPNLKCSVNYGDRGITYVPEWEHFENFCRDMGIRPSHHYSLERVDNSKSYSPQNCIWADRFTQAANRRTFNNNTTGVRGVTKARSGRFVARCQIENERYKLAGTFNTPEQAEEELLKFYALMRSGEVKLAMKMTEQKARFDSSTGIRGITRHQDGGHLVRVTKGGNRIYLGYFLNLESAKERLEKWKLENK
jgi:hypothetical protein